MNGKVCIITGANAGIGKATALGLANKGATVVMVCRNRRRGEIAKAEIIKRSGNKSIVLLLADLSSQLSIRDLVVDFKKQQKKLHVLINNAATIPRIRTITVDGIETQFAVNYLSGFLLANLLLDMLKMSAPSRIINITSDVHESAQLNIDDLQSEKSYVPSSVYALTKIANVLFTYEMAQRLKGTHVTVNCLHPGRFYTKILGDYQSMSRVQRFILKIRNPGPEKGALLPLYLATSPELENVSGKYFKMKNGIKSFDLSCDTVTANRLWQISSKLTCLTGPI